jgi:starvation-inducible DNA-binding protein
MAVRNLGKTRIDLPAEARQELVTLLNARLADTADYRLQLKQAHWNVKGREFVSLHEMFDAMSSEVDGYSDLVAERAVMLGGQALGTLQSAAARTTLAAYPTEITGAADHLSALADRLGKLAAAVRAAIDVAARLGDADTADLFTEVSRGLDKQLWYLDAHLAS